MQYQNHVGLQSHLLLSLFFMVDIFFRNLKKKIPQNLHLQGKENGCNFLRQDKIRIVIGEQNEYATWLANQKCCQKFIKPMDWYVSIHFTFICKIQILKRENTWNEKKIYLNSCFHSCSFTNQVVSCTHDFILRRIWVKPKFRLWFNFTVCTHIKGTLSCF